MDRHAVHMAKEYEAAVKSGKRWHKGELVVVQINAKKMYDDGYKFFISDNKLYFTDMVPIKYCEVKDLNKYKW